MHANMNPVCLYMHIPVLYVETMRACPHTMTMQWGCCSAKCWQLRSYDCNIIINATTISRTNQLAVLRRRMMVGQSNHIQPILNLFMLQLHAAMYCIIGYGLDSPLLRPNLQQQPLQAGLPAGLALLLR
jgi:hypothetical protein